MPTYPPRRTHKHQTMAPHHSADARTALLATYIARHTNAQGGMRITPTAPCSARSDESDGDGGKRASAEGFGARGRTIYNAETCAPAGGGGKGKCAVLRELARIDAEEARRRKWGDAYLMAARGDFEEGRPGAEEVAPEEDVFALYTHI